MDTFTLNTSWLHGKYPALQAEIDTGWPYISVGDFFAQGSEADKIINEIHHFWKDNDITAEQAVARWRDMYL